MMTAKKILLAATAAVTALVATPALAADLGIPVLKAPPPPPAPVYTWTGCYLGGGGGYGLWNQDNFTVHEIGGLATTSQTTTAGGRGGFGTVQVGCDYQLSGDWVIGAFADWDFGSLTGKPELSNELWFGTEKQNWSWAVGGRVGYLVLPQLLAYVSGGFTQANFQGFELFFTNDGDPINLHIPAHKWNGWFIGSGYEYALKWLPGLYWKTEYRYSQYSGADLPIIDDTTGLATNTIWHANKIEQTIRSELVWRFNWEGPVRTPY